MKPAMENAKTRIIVAGNHDYCILRYLVGRKPNEDPMLTNQW